MSTSARNLIALGERRGENVRFIGPGFAYESFKIFSSMRKGYRPLSYKPTSICPWTQDFTARKTRKISSSNH